MSRAENLAKALYPDWECTGVPNIDGQEESMVRIQRVAYIKGYHQAEKDVAEAFARIISGNLSGIGNGIQSMFEQLYTDITGEKMYKGFKD